MTTEVTWMTDKHTRRCPPSAVTRETYTKTTRYHCTPTRATEAEKPTTASAGEDLEHCRRGKDGTAIGT